MSFVHVFEYEMHRFDRKKHIERKPNSIWERLKLHACNRQNGKTFASDFFLCSMRSNRWYFFDFLAYFRWLFLHWNEQIKNFTHSPYSYMAKKVVLKPPNNDWLCIVQCAKYWNVGNEFNRINHMIFEMCWFSTTAHKKKLMHIRCNCSRFGWFCFGVDCLLQFYTIYIGYYPESLSVLDSIPKNITDSSKCRCQHFSTPLVQACQCLEHLDSLLKI